MTNFKVGDRVSYRDPGFDAPYAEGEGTVVGVDVDGVDVVSDLDPDRNNWHFYFFSEVALIASGSPKKETQALDEEERAFVFNCVLQARLVGESSKAAALSALDVIKLTREGA